MIAALASHRRRLESRIVRMQRQMHDLDHLITGRECESMLDKEQRSVDPATERQLAAALFNRIWALLEQEARSEAEEAEMIHAAHTSTYHWMRIGQPVSRARRE
jgi:hypothetical protein